MSLKDYLWLVALAAFVVGMTLNRDAVILTSGLFAVAAAVDGNRKN